MEWMLLDDDNGCVYVFYNNYLPLYNKISQRTATRYYNTSPVEGDFTIIQFHRWATVLCHYDARKSVDERHYESP